MKIKKIAITGIIMILVMMFLGTCEAGLQEEETEYTDVVYSADGSQITLYLDGVGVPVTPAQRAVNRELATMAYDYFEVVFVSASGAVAGNVARTAWELGQPAGIANVPRGTGTGINYEGTPDKAIASPIANIACMFVGKKSDKTLLGVGYISSTRPALNDGATPTPAALPYNINNSTTSVTFSIAAIQTGLLVGPYTGTVTESIDPGTGTISGTQVAGVMFDSFRYTASTVTTPSPANNYSARSTSNSTRDYVNGSPLKYPRYALPQTNGATVDATYSFSHIGMASKAMWNFIKVINADAGAGIILDGHPLIQKRVPRFMSGGRYMEPKEGWTTTTKVAFYGAAATPTNYLPSGTGAIANRGVFNPDVTLRFTVTGSGIFSFYIQIPVFMLVDTSSEFNGAGDAAVAAQKWFVRTGVGSELYSLDDGAANGGCVFMSVGVTAANWLDIEWTWL